MAIIKVITPSVTDANITAAKITDNAITLAKMASGTDGNIISYDASGNPVAIATGNDGQVLTSTGAGSPPAFETIAAGGKIGQVVTQTLTTVTSISAGSFVATGLTLNITPSASNSKIYLVASISTSGASTDYNQAISFFRGSTIIGAAANVGNRIGSMSQGRTNTSVADSIVLTFVDSPSSTSQLTYTVKLYGEAGITHYVNRTGQDADEAHKGRTSSTITALEVLA